MRARRDGRRAVSYVKKTGADAPEVQVGLEPKDEWMTRRRRATEGVERAPTTVPSVRTDPPNNGESDALGT